MKQIAFLSAPVLLASQVAAHPGAHLHPHDGAHWLAVVSVLAVIGFAGGVVALKVRSRK